MYKKNIVCVGFSSVVSGIYWGSWNLCSRVKGGLLYSISLSFCADVYIFQLSYKFYLIFIAFSITI